MVETSTIAIGVVAIILVYVIWQYLTDSYTQIGNMQKASVRTTIPANTLPPNNNPSNFSISLWFYVTNWSCGQAANTKDLFKIKGGQSGTDTNFLIKLGACQNDLDVVTKVNSSNGGVTDSTCHVSNIPIQRWVCLIVSIYGRTLDVYLDGKLVRTCVLPSVSIALANQSQLTNIEIGGGFDGFITSIKYKAQSVNPQEAWNTYTDGYGGSMLQDILNKYKLKFSFMVDDVEKQTITI
jgi:Concanavalin A-like lectin/glucanases superfamily